MEARRDGGVCGADGAAGGGQRTHADWGRRLGMALVAGLCGLSCLTACFPIFPGNGKLVVVGTEPDMRLDRTRLAYSATTNFMLFTLPPEPWYMAREVTALPTATFVQTQHNVAVGMADMEHGYLIHAGLGRRFGWASTDPGVDMGDGETHVVPVSRTGHVESPGIDFPTVPLTDGLELQTPCFTLRVRGTVLEVVPVAGADVRACPLMRGDGCEGVNAWGDGYDYRWPEKLEAGSQGAYLRLHIPWGLQDHPLPPAPSGGRAFELHPEDLREPGLLAGKLNGHWHAWVVAWGHRQVQMDGYTRSDRAYCLRTVMADSPKPWRHEFHMTGTVEHRQAAWRSRVKARELEVIQAALAARRRE